MNHKTSNSKLMQIKKRHVNEPHVNIFHDLLKRKSILLTLFDTKSKEVINHCAQAPSPSKDYCQLIVNFDKVIYRWWKITLRNYGDVSPGEIKDNFEDFDNDEIIKHHISWAFGVNFLNYINNVVTNAKLDYLARLPEPIIIKIISYLALEDISKLSQVNKEFRELCRSDRVWVLLYQKYYTRNITKDLYNLAQKKGWRNIFFTNTIKLQVELRREANGENNEQDEERYGSIADNSSIKSYKKNNNSKDSVIRRHSIATTRKSVDDFNNNPGYLSGSRKNN